MTPLEFIDTMTPAQQRVAEQLVAGKANDEIAAALGLSVKTVKGHLSAIYKGTECANARQFIVWYLTGNRPWKPEASSVMAAPYTSAVP
jgi:DNA-binding NarL/FixJ family response regulator